MKKRLEKFLYFVVFFSFTLRGKFSDDLQEWKQNKENTNPEFRISRDSYPRKLWNEIKGVFQVS